MRTMSNWPFGIAQLYAPRQFKRRYAEADCSPTACTEGQLQGSVRTHEQGRARKTPGLQVQQCLDILLRSTTATTTDLPVSIASFRGTFYNFRQLTESQRRQGSRRAHPRPTPSRATPRLRHAPPTRLPHNRVHNPPRRLRPRPPDGRTSRTFHATRELRHPLPNQTSLSESPHPGEIRPTPARLFARHARRQHRSQLQGPLRPLGSHLRPRSRPPIPARVRSRRPARREYHAPDSGD